MKKLSLIVLGLSITHFSFTASLPSADTLECLATHEYQEEAAKPSASAKDTSYPLFDLTTFQPSLEEIIEKCLMNTKPLSPNESGLAEELIYQKGDFDLFKSKPEEEQNRIKETIINDIKLQSSIIVCLNNRKPYNDSYFKFTTNISDDSFQFPIANKSICFVNSQCPYSITSISYSPAPLIEHYKRDPIEFNCVPPLTCPKEKIRFFTASSFPANRITFLEYSANSWKVQREQVMHHKISTALDTEEEIFFKKNDMLGEEKQETLESPTNPLVVAIHCLCNSSRNCKFIVTETDKLEKHSKEHVLEKWVEKNQFTLFTFTKEDANNSITLDSVNYTNPKVQSPIKEKLRRNNIFVSNSDEISLADFMLYWSEVNVQCPPNV